METLRIALTFTLGHEGGKVDDPTDPGGRTAYGITQSTYNDYLAEKGLSGDVFDITQEEVLTIYRDRYWKPIHGDRLKPELAIVLFDTAVNFGVKGATEFLQDALRITQDGQWGAQTDSAVSRCDQSLTAVHIVALRIDYRFTQAQRFWLGWVRRDVALLEKVKEAIL
jgi:lysozyme family protein